MEAVFHPEALDEYDAAVQSDAQIQPQLGQRFHANVEAAIDRLSKNPLTFATLEQDVRRCLARVFPYPVLYTIEPDNVLIVAVMHCHRKPDYWRHRMVSEG